MVQILGVLEITGCRFPAKGAAIAVGVWDEMDLGQQWKKVLSSKIR
jgi:hypothetical protein